MQIYKRAGSPHLHGRFQYKNKEYRKSLDTAVESIAKKRLREWYNQVCAGVISKRTFGHTYDEAALSFASEHMPTLTKTSQSRYVTSMIHLARSFEGKRLGEIGKAELHELEMRRRRETHAGKPVSPSTIRRDMRCLSSIFSHCIAKDWVEINPVSVYMLSRRRHGALRQGAPKTRYLSHEEEKALLHASPAVLRFALILSIDLGFRREELFGLKWADIDFVKGEVTLAPERTKNHKGRTIPLLPRATQELRMALKHGEYVVSQPNGKRYFDMRHMLETARKKAGISYVSWHDLRRTCGCRLLQDHGMPIERVSKWLGHSSVGVTEKSYAFLEIQHLHNAIKA